VAVKSINASPERGCKHYTLARLVVKHSRKGSGRELSARGEKAKVLKVNIARDRIRLEAKKQ